MRTTRRGLFKVAGIGVLYGGLGPAACSVKQPSAEPAGASPQAPGSTSGQSTQGPGSGKKPEPAWGEHTIEPLTVPLPAGLTAWVQPNGSTQFYWDRCWVSDTSNLPGSTFVLVRLFGQGGSKEGVVGDAVNSLLALVREDVEAGGVQELGAGSSRLDLTSDKGAGAVWSLFNGVSQAIVLLYGPGVTKDQVDSFQASLSLAEETARDTPPEGWQRRQAAGLSVLVGSTWNDVGNPPLKSPDAKKVWARGWVRRVNHGLGPVQGVMVGSGFEGASLAEVSAAFVQDPKVGGFRDSSAQAFKVGEWSGQRVDFTWGDAEEQAGAAWFLRAGEVNKGVMFLHWGKADDAYWRDRETIEAGIIVL